MADKKFKIVTKSDNFIYFVAMCDEDVQWHFNVGLKSTALYDSWTSWDYSKVFKHEISGLYVIAQFKLSIRHHPNYMRLTPCENSPYKTQGLRNLLSKRNKKSHY